MPCKLKHACNTKGGALLANITVLSRAADLACKKGILAALQESKGAEWVMRMYRYVEELEGNEASTSGWDVLFYGDSIMEEWRCCTSPFACMVLPKAPPLGMHGKPCRRNSILIEVKFMVAC